VARVGAAELERLKSEVSVVRLAAARGVVLRRHGAGGDLVGLCPFHDDREPSLVVSPGKNLWHCLGACQAGGSVIDWVMRAEGVSFRHAVELLRADRPAPSGAAPRVVKSTVTKLPAPVAIDAEDEELLDQVVGYYHETLRESPKALSYLAGRGLGDEAAMAHFRLGYADRTLGYRLPNKQRAAGAAIRGRLQKLGLYRESGHEHFNGCVVMPVTDASGRVVEIYGRKIAANLKPEIPRHLYLPGPHRGVWNVEALAGAEEVILCEALFDALTFWCAGLRQVTAAYGTAGLTDEHVEAFRAAGVARVLIAYDRDEAGDRGAAKAAERLGAAGIGAFRVEFPRGMDANEYAGKVGPPGRSLGLVLRHARWMGPGEPPARRATAVPVPEPLAAKREEKREAAPAVAPDEVAEAAVPALPAPPLAASPVASPPASPAAPEVPAEVREEEVVITLGDRRWRVRGLGKNLSYDTLRINLLAARGPGFHVDTLDLYSARQRTAYAKAAAEELGVAEDQVKADLGRVLLKLEELQEEAIRRAVEPESKLPAMTSEEREAALGLLADPGLAGRIVADLGRAGVVGEDTNKLLGYLAAVSRKLDRPLAVVVQSSSAAGKSVLVEAVLSLVPEEDRVAYSAMTGQSLFYMGEADLAHRVLSVAEEEGAERASYALKLLQSEGELTIASTGKDPATGRLVTHEYRVEGPVAIFLTTTAIDVDEELLNRCLVLSVDEAREQTRAIHRLQRERRTLAGLLARQERDGLARLHQNAQRLLRPLPVVNPYARELTFLDTRTRTRRDHEKYLTLIDAIALLHQHQRPVREVEHRGRRVEYVEVALADVELANRLAHEALGRSLDELPPQTRRLLDLLDRMVTEACERRGMERSDYRFTRKEVRRATGWGNTQLKVHLGRLEELEYLVVHQGGRGRTLVYELAYEAQAEAPERFLAGLIDIARLREGRGYDGKKSGPGEEKSAPSVEKAGPGRPQVGRVSGGGRGEKSPSAPGDSSAPDPPAAGNAHLETGRNRAVAASRTPAPPLAARAGGAG
jgi:DNA primase catalytic core